MKYPRVFRQRMSQDDYDWIRATALDMRMSQQEIGRWALRLLREELDRVQGEGGIASRVVQASVEVERVRADPPKKPGHGARPKQVKGKPEKDPSKRDLRSVEDRALGKLAAITRQVEQSRTSDP